MKVKQARRQRLQFAAVTFGLIQRLRRRMQELVGQPVRQLIKHTRRIVSLGQQLERMLHFVATGTFGGIAQGTDYRHRFARLQPCLLYTSRCV